MKKILLALAAAMVAVAIAVPVAFSAGGAQVTSECPNAGVLNPATGLPNCQFRFFDGNGTPNVVYSPTAFQDVLTPSGNETETFKGTIANDTGHAVIYTADSGAPIDPSQTCFSFVTGAFTPDWQLTISASGKYSLVCHF